jgi:hypothetical protein
VNAEPVGDLRRIVESAESLAALIHNAEPVVEYRLRVFVEDVVELKCRAERMLHERELQRWHCAARKDGAL